MLPFTDFLAYKEGSYHRTPESFKFNGYHLVKLIGWSKAMDGSTEWIAENSWGPDWGADEPGHWWNNGGYALLQFGANVCGMDQLGACFVDGFGEDLLPAMPEVGTGPNAIKNADPGAKAAFISTHVGIGHNPVFALPPRPLTHIARSLRVSHLIVCLGKLPRTLAL